MACINSCICHLPSAICDGQGAVVICAADGTVLGFVNAVEDAVNGIIERGLDLVPLH
jgi:hypothetical protein